MPHVVADFNGRPYHLVGTFKMPGAGYTVMFELPEWVNLQTGEVRDYDGNPRDDRIAPQALEVLRRGGAQCGGWTFILVDLRNYGRLLGMVAAFKEGLASEGEGRVVVVSRPDSRLTVRHLADGEEEGWEKVQAPA